MTPADRAIGGHGIISVAAHLAGKLIREMVISSLLATPPGALALHLKLMPLFKGDLRDDQPRASEVWPRTASGFRSVSAPPLVGSQRERASRGGRGPARIGTDLDQDEGLDAQAGLRPLLPFAPFGIGGAALRAVL